MKVISWGGRKKLMDLEFEEGRNYSVEITQEIDGFLISYHKILFNGFSLEKTDIKLLLRRIAEVAKVLNVKASQFVLEIVPDGITAAGCNVDKRNVVHLVLPIDLHNGHITIPSREIDENYLLYHELMHAKDVLEGRFPSCGIIDSITDFREYLRGFACDFSIEGRLEKNGIRHCPKEQAIENVYQCIVENHELGLFPEESKSISKGFLTQLCDSVWGKELTSSEIDAIIRKLNESIDSDSVQESKP